MNVSVHRKEDEPSPALQGFAQSPSVSRTSSTIETFITTKRSLGWEFLTHAARSQNLTTGGEVGVTLPCFTLKKNAHSSHFLVLDIKNISLVILKLLVIIEAQTFLVVSD